MQKKVYPPSFKDEVVYVFLVLSFRGIVEKVGLASEQC